MALHAMPPVPDAPHEQSQEPSEKPLPSSKEAELAVLGSIVIDPEQMARVASFLTPQDFYIAENRAIYAAMLALHNAQEPVEYVTLYDELERSGHLAAIGGAGVVFGLGNQVPSSKNALYYARIVRRCARNRAFIACAAKIAGAAYSGADDDALCDLAMREVLAIAQRGSTSGDTRTKSFADILDELAENVLARLDADGPIGMPTGFAELDRHIVSMEPGDLIYLAGRPGSGKSALGLKLAMQAALHCHATGKGTVDVVTLEMGAIQQARRLVADGAELNTRYIRAGFRPANLPQRDPDLEAWAAFDRQRMWLRERIGERLYVTDGVVSLSYLRSLIQRAVAERGTRLVVIDQLDLFSDGAEQEEFQRVTKMSRQLKQIAKACGVTVLCMVQLSRKCEERANKRPILSDLRQSGQLEQDADMVWGLYRPAYYDPQNEDAHFQQFAELLLLKGRDVGSGEMVPLRFEAEYTRFREWPDEWAEPHDATRSDGNGKE